MAETDCKIDARAFRYFLAHYLTLLHAATKAQAARRKGGAAKSERKAKAARANGKRRAVLSVENVRWAKRARKDGETLATIARALGVSVSTVSNYLKKGAR